MGERPGSGGAWREPSAPAPPGQPRDAGAAPSGPPDPAGAPPGPPRDAERNGQPGGGSEVANAGRNGQPDGAGDETAIPDLLERIAELEDLRLRALADLDNLRKRCATQVARAEAETRAAVAREWLPVVDNLERALAYSGSDPAAIIDGIRAVREQALSVLARLGYPRRDDQGAAFDPVRHDAVATRADPAAPDGSVVEVVRPAYGEGDHQLRPAQVVVARPG
jgi:molecular chaperone GrpE